MDGTNYSWRVPRVISTKSKQSDPRDPARLDAQMILSLAHDPDARLIIERIAEKQATETARPIANEAISEMRQIQQDLDADLRDIRKMLSEILSGEREEAPSNPIQEILERLDRLENRMDELSRGRQSLRP